MDNKINSYSLRNDKSNEIINTMIYIFQKILLQVNNSNNYNRQYEDNIVLNHLVQYYVFYLVIYS